MKTYYIKHKQFVPIKIEDLNTYNLKELYFCYDSGDGYECLDFITFNGYLPEYYLQHYDMYIKEITYTIEHDITYTSGNRFIDSKQRVTRFDENNRNVKNGLYEKCRSKFVFIPNSYCSYEHKKWCIHLQEMDLCLI